MESAKIIVLKTAYCVKVIKASVLQHHHFHRLLFISGEARVSPWTSLISSAKCLSDLRTRAHLTTALGLLGPWFALPHYPWNWNFRKSSPGESSLLSCRWCYLIKLRRDSAQVPTTVFYLQVLALSWLAFLCTMARPRAWTCAECLYCI